MTNEFITRIEDTIEKYRMLDGVSSLLIGYSGGADSTALLFAMRDIALCRGINIFCAHVDHMIRGDDALHDYEHCRMICERLGVTFFGTHIDIPALAKERGEGIEECARRERYAYFDSLCAEHGIDKIAVAHNSGDNFETVLFNLARGSSVRGLCGIPPVRESIVRPLIECSRREIEAYCAEIGEKYVTDKTNSDTAYSRNYIRHEIVPRLLTLNPSAEKNVSRMCFALRRDADFLDKIAKDTDVEGDALTIRRIVDAYKNVSGGKTLESVHIENALKLIKKGTLHSSVSLPDKLCLRITREGLDIVPDVREKSFGEPDAPIVLSGEGIYDLCRGGRVILTKEDINIYKLSIHKGFNSVKIKGTVVCRYRREGDTIVCGGHRKSVKKLLTERKISPDDRHSLPFFCDDDGIFFIPGVAVRDGASGSDFFIAFEK